VHGNLSKLPGSKPVLSKTPKRRRPPSWVKLPVKLSYKVLSKDKQYFALKTPYDKEFVDELRKLIPNRKERRFDFDRKVWILPNKYYKAVIDLTERFFVDFEELKRRLQKYRSKKDGKVIVYTFKEGFDDVKDRKLRNWLLTLVVQIPYGHEFESKICVSPYLDKAEVLLPEKGFHFRVRGHHLLFLRDYSRQHLWMPRTTFSPIVLPNQFKGFKFYVKEPMRFISLERYSDLLKLPPDKFIELVKKLNFKLPFDVDSPKARRLLSKLIKKLPLDKPDEVRAFFKFTSKFIRR